MPFLRSKINPFSSLTIILGPLYVERVFDSILTKKGVRQVVHISEKERYTRYLDFLDGKLIPKRKSKLAITQFYKGYFCHQLATLGDPLNQTSFLLEKALTHYQTYLNLPYCKDEGAHYSHWQIGVLQSILKYPWSHSESSFFPATKTDLISGEALQQIISSGIQRQDWEKTYILSSQALQAFFGKNPAAYRRWFVNENACNRHVADLHLLICHKLGHLAETRNLYKKLKSYTVLQSAPCSPVENPCIDPSDILPPKNSHHESIIEKAKR